MTGHVVWFTGLPASGKTTLARMLQTRLDGRPVLLDSDEVRGALDAGEYERADRDAFYSRLGRLAALVAAQGHVVLVAATASRRAYRDRARALSPHFVEVWVRTPLAECEQRDIKGLYARARAGTAPHVPGLGEPYEEPVHAEVIAESGRDTRALDALVRILTG